MFATRKPSHFIVGFGADALLSAGFRPAATGEAYQRRPGRVILWQARAR
jgi:hypothetical protein